MPIVPQFAPYLCTSFPLLTAPPKRLALPAPKIVGYLPSTIAPSRQNTAGDYAGSPLRHAVVVRRSSDRKTSTVVIPEIAETPENRARLADSFDDFLRSLGPWLTLDDAHAVIERHNRIYEEKRAKREAENARYMAALNDWWNQYLAAPNNKARQALIAARPSMLQAAEVQS